MAEKELGFDVWFKTEPEPVLVAHPSPPCDTIMAGQLSAPNASSRPGPIKSSEDLRRGFTGFSKPPNDRTRISSFYTCFNRRLSDVNVLLSFPQTFQSVGRWNVLRVLTIRLEIPIPKDVCIVLTRNGDGVFTGCGETQRR